MLLFICNKSIGKLSELETVNFIELIPYLSNYTFKRQKPLVAT